MRWTTSLNLQRPEILKEFFFQFSVQEYNGIEMDQNQKLVLLH